MICGSGIVGKTGHHLYSSVKYFGYYALLTYHPDKFKNIDPITVYYNRYYWYLRFYNSYLRFKGSDDLNLQQIEYRILEDGGSYPDIDWNVFEEISNYVKERRE